MTTPLRCLIVDEDENDARLLLRQLRAADYDVTSERVDTPEAMRAALERLPWDVVLADDRMPHFSGMDALALVRSTVRDLPFILVSGTIGEDFAVAALKAGANDYLMKGNLARLGPAVQRELRDAVERGARRRAEAALEEIAVRHRAILATALDGYWLVNRAGRLQEANEAYGQMSGYSVEELRDMHVSDLEALETAAHVADHLQRIIGEGVDRFETRHRRKDGKVFDVGVSAQFLPAHGGVYVCFLRDITARKAAQAALEKMQWLQAETERIGHVGGWEFDIDTQQQIWTDEVYRIHEVDGSFKPNVDQGINFYTPESQPIIARAVQQAVEDGEPFDLHLEIITARGNRKSVHAIGSPDLPNHKIRGVLQDVTARARAESALLESESRFKRAIVDSPMPLLLHAEDGAILQASNSWCEISGYTHEELATIGDWIERAYGERKALVQREIDALYGLDHRKYEGDYSIRTKSGETRIWEFSSAPLGRLPDGRRTVISMALDVTERRSAEAAVRRMAMIADSAPNSITVHGFDGRYLWANRRTSEMHGYSHDEFMELNLRQVDVPTSAMLIEARMLDLRARGEATFEVVHRCKDGRSLPFHVAATVIAWDDKDAILSVATDITEREQVAEELRHHAADLSSRNEELRLFNRAAVGRELRMIELKQEVNALCERLGEPPRHALDFLDDASEATGIAAVVPPEAS